MPGRISRTSVPLAAPSGKASSRQSGSRKRKQRGLDAFSIAEETDGSLSKTRRHRFGELEDGGTNRKKQKLAEEEDDEGQEESYNQRQRPTEKSDPEALDISGGSDSEGGEWRVGQVGQDDDSDIDSDEAFGESDEERFEGFKFGGSSSRNSNSYLRKNPAAASEEDSGDDLGEDAVDLAAMLDQDGESNEEDRAESDPDSSHSVDEEAPNGSESDEEDASSFAMSDVDSDNDDPERQQQLREIARSFSGSKATAQSLAGEADQKPTFASALAALKASSGLDPAFDNEVKKLSKSIRPSKGSQSTNLVKVPLPKRQQDRIDRKAAYSKAKDSLNRWIDTVKHNRRADHLVFPMPNLHAQEPQGQETFTPAPRGLPSNKLERAIQSIMEQSGLKTQENQAEEDQVLESEGLQAKKLPVEELMARTAELRRARELLFREEARAKRIKKIKSRAYRRVHRKDAQRAAQKERNLLMAAGIDMSEDEREANDRKRAEERMGARHKESKWAKNMKQAGRTAWDKEARDGVQEMARRNDDLRKRIQGQPASDETNTDYDSGSESDAENGTAGDDGDSSRTSERILNDIEQLDSVGPQAQDSTKLASMKFMQRAEAARKQRNDQELKSMQMALQGDADEDEEDVVLDSSVGRKLFGPGSKSNEIPAKPKVERLEFEEPEDPGEEDEDTGSRPQDHQLINSKPSAMLPVNGTKQSATRSQKSSTSLSRMSTKPFAAQANLQQPRSTRSSKADVVASSEPQPGAVAANELKTGNWTTIDYRSGPERSGLDDTKGQDLTDATIPSNLELVQAAFGGDDVEAAFAAEKASAESSEDEKVVDGALPGWGSWTGNGISKREKKRTQQRTKGRFLTKEEGVKPSNRKDKGMERVIISEKRSKKNAKYLASMLPHPFESRQQYERGITQPIGPEWSTKETFQSATKPRVLIKPGRLIEPISAPIV